MARRKAAARGKISIDEGFRKLMAALGPHGAVKRMNEALLDPKDARLRCNGKAVDPGFILTHLVVRARMIDGHWTAEVKATRALDEPVEAHTWQMDAKQIEALLPQPDTKAEAMQTATTVATAAAEAARSEAATARAEAMASDMTIRSDPEPEPRRRPGPKYKDDWPMLVAAETIRLARHQPEMLENLEALVRHMHTFLKEEIGWMEDNEKEIREKLRFLLNI